MYQYNHTVCGSEVVSSIISVIVRFVIGAPSAPNCSVSVILDSLAVRTLILGSISKVYKVVNKFRFHKKEVLLKAFTQFLKEFPEINKTKRIFRLKSPFK